MSNDSFLNIDTPENVVFGYEVAGIGSRFLAALLDSFLILVLMFIAYLTAGLLMTIIGTDDFGTAAIAFFGLIAFVILWGYYILFEIIWNGQSPGKRLQGLRVLRQDGTPVSASEATIRNLIRIIDFLPFAYGVGVVTMFINGQSRRLGDLAAGTLVIREKGTITLDSLAESAKAPVDILAEPASLSGTNYDFPIEKLANKDIELAEEFLRRRDQLGNREYVARQVARSLYRKMELDWIQTTTLRSEDAIIYIVQTYRQKNALNED
jgi:uncharacterized RDD family membrane protein YckC